MWLTPGRRDRRANDERGAVAIIVAVSMVMLLIVTAMVLDFGLVRLNRQQVKSAADSAVMSALVAADGGTDKVYPFRGVCAALDFLKANESALSGLPPGICGSPNLSVTCDPTNPNAVGKVALYQATLTSDDVITAVKIKSPYLSSEDGFTEEGLASLSADTSAKNGCDQVGVVITRSRQPGLGSLATSGDLKLRVRAVGRVEIREGDLAPALILLEQTRCQVLTNGSSGAGNTSKIFVYGTGTMPGSVHSDSAATDSGCGSGPNQQLLAGNKANGIVAFGTSAGLSGVISTYATALGRAVGIVSDGTANIYGTNATTEAGLPGTKTSMVAREPVGRLLVDQRYLPGMTSAVRGAYPQWLLNHSSPIGYTRFGCPTAADMTALAAMSSSSSVYIDCPSNSGITLDGTIGAGRVYFHGFIKGGKLRLPNATQVYIDNTDNSGAKVKDTALSLSNGNGFCIRASLCDDFSTGTCSSASTGIPAQAQLFVRRGTLNSSGGLLRMCNTTVIMEGGQLGLGTAASPGGCLPTTPGTAPTTTPCTGASTAAGSGYIQLAGATDWTSPNQYDAMTALTAAQKQAAWNNGEDLALWDETYAVAPDFKMAGGAELNVSGVFMLPNAFPIVFSGGATFDLRDAQFITRSFAVDGGAQLLMRVDPNNAITLPRLKYVLVR